MKILSPVFQRLKFQTWWIGDFQTSFSYQNHESCYRNSKRSPWYSSAVLEDFHHLVNSPLARVSFHFALNLSFATIFAKPGVNFDLKKWFLLPIWNVTLFSKIIYIKPSHVTFVTLVPCSLIDCSNQSKLFLSTKKCENAYVNWIQNVTKFILLKEASNSR